MRGRTVAKTGKGKGTGDYRALARLLVRGGMPWGRHPRLFKAGGSGILVHTANEGEDSDGSCMWFSSSMGGLEEKFRQRLYSSPELLARVKKLKN